MSNHRRHGKKAPIPFAPKPRRTLRESISDLLEVPESTFSGLPQLDLMGNRHLTVEGHEGVLEYDEHTIRLNLGEVVLKITGRDLSMAYMTGRDTEISGFIESMEFLL